MGQHHHLGAVNQLQPLPAPLRKSCRAGGRIAQPRLQHHHRQPIRQEAAESVWSLRHPQEQPHFTSGSVGSRLEQTFSASTHPLLACRARTGHTAGDRRGHGELGTIERRQLCIVTPGVWGQHRRKASPTCRAHLKSSCILQEPQGNHYVLSATSTTELGLSVRTWSKQGTFSPL